MPPAGYKKSAASNKKQSEATKRRLATVQLSGQACSWKLPYAFEKDGEIFQGMNLKEFCRDQGLHEAAMHRLKTGVINHHKGWTRKGEPLPVFRVVSPDWKDYSFTYLTKSAFLKEHGLGSQWFNKMLYGQIDHCKGWRLKTDDV